MRWRNPNAFRVDRAAGLAVRPSRRQSVALLAVLALVAGLIAAISYVVRPQRARAFDLFNGSLFLNDTVAPVAVDLATGSPSVRLIDATAQIGASAQQSTDLAVVPLARGGGTLLLNRASGEFNMVDPTGFVIKRDGGVPLPKAEQASATALPADSPAAPDLAYIEQTGKSATRVYLVSQSTVREAIGANRVKPRASASLDAPASTKAGAQASADGDLWLLLGTGRRRTVTQLALPRASHENGATLRRVAHGTVRGPAALGSATLGASGARSAIGVATSDRITVFGPDGSTRTVGYTPPAGVDTVLPTSNQAGRLAFLLHGAGGWSLVSIGADGTQLRGPTPLANVAGTADLVAPAASAGNLYTLDRRSGELLRIGADGGAARIPGAGTYPRILGSNGRPVEPGGWGDAYVIARGARVFYDSPSHREALAVFTDGTRPPLVVQKSAAVGVNAVADAAALTRSRNQPSHATNQRPGTKPPHRSSGRGPAPIDNNIDCRTTTQQPNIPQIYGVQAGSRSVTFSWLYPRLNNQDCIPRTYVVTATLLSGDAPPAPGSVTVQDQQSVTLTGLYPASTYAITVTAYLGRFSTPSAPVRIETSPQGPDAPTNVRVHADANGNWVLSWDSCGGVAQHCVPSASWQVEPHLCDGRGLVGALPPLDVAADPTTRRQPPAVYHGGTALLGRGLSFQVMGRGLDNLPGTFSAPTPCVYSWAPPVPSAMQLTASTASQTDFGTTTTADVTLNLGTDPVRDIGGVGARVTFTLTGNGATQTKGPMALDGSTSTVSAVFSGITAGASYHATAMVQPAHGGTPVVLTAPQVSTRSTWPAYSVSATCPQVQELSCDLQVDLSGISSANSRGEQFSLTSNSEIRCNNDAQRLSKVGFDPATAQVTTTLSQLDGYYGSCTVSVQLVEDAPQAAHLVYGGLPSPVQTVNVTLAGPTEANVGYGDLHAGWDAQGSSAAGVYYTGSQNLADLTDNWSETVTAPGGVQQCGSAAGVPGSSPGNALLIPIDPTCVKLYGALPGDWTVTVDFANRTDGKEGGPFVYSVPGPPPGYQACDPQGLTASWGTTQADGISVTMDASSDTSGCSHWQYALYDGSTDPPTQVCSVATDLVVGPPPAHIDTTLCGTPPSDTWFVRVSWLNTAGQQEQQDLPLNALPPS